MERSVERLLVIELSKGSVNAFNKLYKHYCDRLFRFSFLLLKDHDGAEEVVQHVFLKVWEKRSTINPELSFQAYIFKITKNYILKLIQDSFRNQNKIEELTAHPGVPMGNTGSGIIYSELKRKARREITNLPCQRKKVFIMSRKFNLTNKEIADNLLISVNTVKRHMNLALKTLNQVLYY
ncbi:RNA polymerase sigma-70 factor [Bacteroidota bacterium]